MIVSRSLPHASGDNPAQLDVHVIGPLGTEITAYLNPAVDESDR